MKLKRGENHYGKGSCAQETVGVLGI